MVSPGLFQGQKNRVRPAVLGDIVHPFLQDAKDDDFQVGGDVFLLHPDVPMNLQVGVDSFGTPGRTS